ncbi:UDP-N-acetylmuramate dehydrogenase [soil metagenome]
MLLNTNSESQGQHHPLIQTNIPLHDKNWFATGGPAAYFAQPATAQEFQEALTFAREHSLQIFILGKGANILISDQGFDGLVIQPQLTGMQIIDEQLVKAGAGVSMHDLIEYCLAHNLLGLEEFSGIPGTVGGSVYINLHYFQFLLEQFLINATVIHAKTGALETVGPEWFKFGYDESRLQEKEYYLVDATFKLKKCTELETAFANGRRVEIIRHRQSRYPTKNTCGSFFRNFHDHEVTLTSNGKKMIYVAYYLDKMGVKGQLQVGNAIVSYQHANMLVNQGTATSGDLINLARTMQEMVYKGYGIIPQPECQLIGFKEYPLL